MLDGAKEIYKRDATASLLNNSSKEARYFLRSTWVLVVVDGVLATCYQPKFRDFIVP